MLNNLTNFFNLITNRMMKKEPERTDLIVLGTKHPKYGGGYAPTAITVEDFTASIGGGITLSTSGTSGPATLVGNALNIPEYVGLPAFIEYNLSNKTIWNNGYNDNPTNTCIGEDSLQTSIGGFNTAFGVYTLATEVSGAGNTAIGAYAMGFAINSNDCIAIGQQSLYKNEGYGNTAIGRTSMFNNITGQQNTSIGLYTLYNNDSGNNNVAIGKSALELNTTGGDNTAVGKEALYYNTTGNDNTAIGRDTLRTNDVGAVNVAVGAAALYTNTSGSSNIAIGRAALGSNTTGANNVAIGSDAAQGNLTSNASIVIGSQANNNDFSGCIVLGFGAQATAANQFVVGSAGMPAGDVISSAATQSHYWNVLINDVPYKILLST